MLDTIMDKLMILPGIIIGLSLHEAAHARVSYMLGDPTPKNQGRLTINPIAHIDVIGFIALLLCGFGWGKPVQIDPSYYKHRRRDEFLVAIAGVVTNLIIAIIFAFLSGWTYKQYYYTGSSAIETLFYILYYTMTINLVLMVFNLIPVPPLDGFGLITQIFNLQKYSWYHKFYQYGSVILIVLIITDATDYILRPALQWLIQLLWGIVI